MNFDKDLLILWVIRCLGVISLFFFICIRSPYLFEKFTDGCYADHGDFYGELYADSRVLLFKQLLPEANGRSIRSDISQIQKDRVIVIGDSFFWRFRGHDTFPYLLSRRLGETVFYDGERYYNPFLLLRGIISDRKRILILECAERLIYERFYPPFDFHPGLPAPPSSGFQAAVGQIRNRWFIHSEKNYRFFMRNGILTSPLVECWNSFQFKIFGEIDLKGTPYSLHPPTLFLDEETDPKLHSSFYFDHSDPIIEGIAQNLEKIRNQLLLEHNTEMIFMPIPNKYTIDHRLANQDPYDQYLPRLYEELEKRGIRTVRLYDLFLSSKDELYYPTDSHWNAKGVSLGLKELIRVLKEMGVAEGEPSD